MRKPRRSWNWPSAPFDEHRRAPRARAHLIADDNPAHRRRDDQVDARRTGRGSFRRGRGDALGPFGIHRNTRASAGARAARPDERMKCPSSSASDARNSSRTCSLVIISERPLGRAERASNRCREQVLEGAGSPAYRGPQIGKREPAIPSSNDVPRGEDATDWMGDRFGRGRAHTGSGPDAAAKLARPRSDHAGRAGRGRARSQSARSFTARPAT